MSVRVLHVGAGLKNSSRFSSMAGKTRPYSIKNYTQPKLAYRIACFDTASTNQSIPGGDSGTG